jgi:hypothetical protein
MLNGIAIDVNVVELAGGPECFTGGVRKSARYPELP